MKPTFWGNRSVVFQAWLLPAVATAIGSEAVVSASVVFPQTSIDRQAEIRFVRTVDVPKSDAVRIRKLLGSETIRDDCLSNLFYYSFAVTNKSDREALDIQVHRPFLPGLFTTAHFLEDSCWSYCELPPYVDYQSADLWLGTISRENIRAWLNSEDDWLSDNPPTVPQPLVDLLSAEDWSFQAVYYNVGWKWLSVPPNEERRFYLLSIPIAWPSPVRFQFECRRREGPSDVHGDDFAPASNLVVFSPPMIERSVAGEVPPGMPDPNLIESRKLPLKQILDRYDWRSDLELLLEWKHETEAGLEQK